MKKLLLTLGTVVSIATPIAAVVACGDKATATDTTDKTKTTDKTDKTKTTDETNTTDKNEETKKYVVPTQGKMFSAGELVLAKLLGGKVLDGEAELTDADKAKFKGKVVDSPAALTVKDATGTAGTWKTKAEWDAFVESSKVKDIKLVLMLEDNKSIFGEVDVRVPSKITPAEIEANFTEANPLTKDGTKDEALAKINSVLADKPELKQIYIDFVNNQPSWEQAYYMLVFMKATSSRDAILNPFGPISALIDIKYSNGKFSTEDERKQYLVDKIQKGKMDINVIANAVIDKFSGKDTDFKPVQLSIAATVDTAKKQLIRGALAWPVASLTMGGDDTVIFIIGSIGYTLVDAPTNP